MSRARSTSNTPQPILPVPQSVLSHHRETLLPKMTTWQETEKVPPVLLLAGPRGIGKREMVHHLAQWLLCEKSGFSHGDDQQESFFSMEPAAPAEPSLEPCGQCVSCQRALKNQWLDFTEIGPESSSGSIKIDQVLEIQAAQGHGAREGAFRIFFIRNADQMTPQAANSLLKILEEPPSRWLFFLTASDASLLLPTLISRSQRLRLKPLTDGAMENFLKEKGVPEDRIPICIRQSAGSWERALYLNEEVNWNKRSSIFNFLIHPTVEFTPLVDWASQDPARMSFLLDQIEFLASDLIRWTITPGTPPAHQHLWINSDARKTLTQYAQKVQNRYGVHGARDFWIEQTENASRLRKRLSTPLNRKMMVQDLLVPWMGN